MPGPRHDRLHVVRPRHAGREAGSVRLRVAALAVLSALLASALASADAYWLCLPAVLVAAALTTSGRGTLVSAAAVALATEAALAWRGVTPMPSPALALAVPGGCIAVLRVSLSRLEHEREHLRGVALTDPLTGVANRRLLHARADYEIARHTRDGRSFALVMLDLDGFKGLNDRFGHAAGDEVLRDIAIALGEALRAQDTIARLGGDEFCVLAPETDRAGLRALTARIREAVTDATAGVQQLAASAGVALFPEDGSSTAELLEAADQRLLEAKRSLYGRTRRRAA